MLSHRTTNSLHSLVLLLGMGLVLMVLGYLLGGLSGALIAAGMGVLVLWLSPRVAPGVILKLYGARPLAHDELPQLHQIVRELARRAGLSFAPRLYYVPTRLMNAFTVGDSASSAVAVTDGLLRALDLREMTGVLAHEISHLKNKDLKVMMLADMISRMTSMLSAVGQILLLLNLPLLFMGEVTISWLAILILLGAPWLATLLQLALSRRREIDADLEAFRMTGDGEGLASALVKMERHQRRFLDWLVPGRRVPDPSILRTHPNTEERIARLHRLQTESRPAAQRMPPFAAAFVAPGAAVERPPRWHVTGLWF